MYSDNVQGLINACQWNTSNFLIISENIFDTLIYYSHILPLIIATIIGVFILFKNPKQLVARIFFLITGLFSLWLLFDLILWATDKPDIIMFFWSVMNLLELFIYATSLYFIQVFISNKDTSIRNKILLLLPLLPFILLIPTKLTLLGFNLSNCDREAIEGPLTHYAYLLEILYILGILVFAMEKYRYAKDFLSRQKIWYSTIGMILFLLIFSASNLIGTITNDWRIPQWGLFGMTIILVFLSYIVAKYNSSDFKLLVGQAVSVTLLILIGSQFFLTSSSEYRILILITFLVSVAGVVLFMRGIKSGEIELGKSKEKEMFEETAIAESRPIVSREPIDRPGKIVLALLITSIGLVIFSTGYRFLWEKNYTFMVETECTVGSESCFARDCEEEECPPNGLEEYRVFNLQAKDFSACDGGSCLNVCVDGSITCEEVMCDSFAGDSCSMPSLESDTENTSAQDDLSPEVTTNNGTELTL